MTNTRDTTVTREVKALVKEFEEATVGLLSATKRDFIDFEQGFYGFLFVEPAQRLKTALAATREILVLCSNFDDQQVRIIKAAKTLLSRFPGRLETTLVMIVHRDASGRVKLKDWGREQGLTVLPLCRGTSPFPRAEALERLLAEEMFSHDPFDVTGPVSDDAHFYGRKQEALEVARQLQLGQIRSFFGIRKVGKTSILNRVISEVRKHHTAYQVMLDCSVDSIWKLDAAGLLQSIASGLRAAKKHPDHYSVALAPERMPTLESATQAMLSEVLSADLPVIVYIDEVDYTGPASPTNHQWRIDFNRFWRALRANVQESSRQTKRLSLFVSGVSSRWFSVESIEGIENAALALIPEEYLAPFPRGASIAMIRQLGSIAGLRFSEDGADYIASACSDMPFWIRKACSFVHKQIPVDRRPISPSRDDVHALIETFMATDGSTMAQVALTHLFRVYPELQQYCISRLASDAPADAALRRVAQKYGILQLESGHWRPGLLVRAGLELVKHTVSSGNKSAETALSAPAEGRKGTELNDWAEDLAVINKRRNQLEASLRSLVLNFLRFDALNKSGGLSVRERILKAIDQSARKKFDSLEPAAIMDKLTWLQLTGIIKTEWPVFEKIFGDSAQFENHRSIINDRPDAHAKQFSTLGLALQDRSLQWFEERVIKG